MAATDTRERLLQAGQELMLEKGFNDSGILELLARTGVPKGSFYHHFDSKEDFGLRVLDRFAEQSLEMLDAHLGDSSRQPLARLRGFFDRSKERMSESGFRHGCLVGICAQELSDVSDSFRRRVAAHMRATSERCAAALAEAREAGEVVPGCDPAETGELLVNGWQGAMLRMKVERSGAPLESFLDFFFGAIQTT